MTGQEPMSFEEFRKSSYYGVHADMQFKRANGETMVANGNPGRRRVPRRGHKRMESTRDPAGACQCIISHPGRWAGSPPILRREPERREAAATILRSRLAAVVMADATRTANPPRSVGQ